MGIVSGIATFFMIWWTALFAVLPWAVRRAEIKPDGNFAGAPEDPKLKQKFIVTTIISIVIWLIVFALAQSDVISFDRMADALRIE